VRLRERVVELLDDLRHLLGLRAQFGRRRAFRVEFFHRRRRRRRRRFLRRGGLLLERELQRSRGLALGLEGVG
jgi:hypothetical protein